MIAFILFSTRTRKLTQGDARVVKENEQYAGGRHRWLCFWREQFQVIRLLLCVRMCVGTGQHAEQSCGCQQSADGAVVRQNTRSDVCGNTTQPKHPPSTPLPSPPSASTQHLRQNCFLFHLLTLFLFLLLFLFLREQHGRSLLVSTHENTSC